MYAYDRTPLNAKLEPVDQDSTDWHKEKITFDAAYGKERMAAYLFVDVLVQLRDDLAMAAFLTEIETAER